MTEYERFIESKRFPEDFFKEEVRNDFLVTKQRKKMWAVLLDMALELDRVCKLHDIKYFISDGSLLGAVRHHGFIPWDDDFDVMMLREDYERFIKLGDEFKEPLFLQTPYSDPTFFYNSARLRNTNTTGLIDKFKYQGSNQGIWLTIFPLDTVDPVHGEEVYNQINSLNIENSTYMRMSNPELDEVDLQRVKNYSGRNPLDTYKEIHTLARQFEKQETGYRAVMVFTMEAFTRKIFYLEDVQETIPWTVEGFEFPIPKGYDRILTIFYGNYLELPPVEERGIQHEGVLWDPDKSYKNYIPVQNK